MSFLSGNQYLQDAMFMPDSELSVVIFPEALLKKCMIYSLPVDTLACPGHDYQPGGRELRYEAPISEHKASNKFLTDKTSKDFIKARRDRDSVLSAPNFFFRVFK